MTPKKVVIYVFRDDQLSVSHALLNAMDMLANGIHCRIILDGESTRLLPEMATPGNALYNLYQEARRLGLFDSVCLKCAERMQTSAAAVAEGLNLDGEMAGHPSMTRFLQDGYQIITI